MPNLVFSGHCPGSRVQRTLKSIMGQQLQRFLWKELNPNEQFSAAFSIWASSSWWSQGVAWGGFARGAVRVVWIEVCALGGSWRTPKGTRMPPCDPFPGLSPGLSLCCHQGCCGSFVHRCVHVAMMLFWASLRKLSNLPVLPFKRNSFRSRSKALIWQVAGVVLPKDGWEVIHPVFVAAAGVAWICYKTPVRHCHSKDAVQNSLKSKSHCSLVDRKI